MNIVSLFVLAMVIGFSSVGVNNVLAYNTIEFSIVGAKGYDVVSFFEAGQPTQGNGNHVVEYEGITYLFSSDENKSTFEKNPQRYLPAYGGYCAYGVSVAKKFHGDPEVWRIVDGTLYFNLDRDIQKLWVKDIPGNIKKAEANWPQIKDKSPSDL